MRRILISFLPLVIVAGCTGTKFQWAATEPVQQAADMVVTDILTDSVDASTAQAAKLVLGYVGQPEKPMAQDPEAKKATLNQAQKDAGRPPPTIENLADEGFRLTDKILTLAIGAAGVLAGGKVVGKLKTARDTAAALREVVIGNESVADHEDMVESQEKTQSKTTKGIVDNILES